MRSGETAMTETRFRLKLMPCAVLVVLSVTVATADAQDCSFSDNPAAFESCSKTIAARQLRGLDLAKIYATRGLLNYFKKDNADAAIADLTEAIKIAPKFAQAYVDRGFVYDNRKRDYDRAIADYSAAIRLEPTNVEAFTRRASAYSSKSQYDLSIADYAQAIRLAPNDSSPYFSRGSTYYYHKQDYDRAIADYNEAIRLNPKSATSVASRGEAYEKKGDLANAHADFRAALAIEADNKWAKEGLARIEPKMAALPPSAPPVTSAGPVICQDVSGAYRAAVEACTSLIASGKANGDDLLAAYIWRGSHLSFLGEHDKAIDDFDRAIMLDPRQALAYRGRGASLEVKGNLDRALADYRMALSIDPGLDDMPAAIQRIQTGRAR